MSQAAAFIRNCSGSAEHWEQDLDYQGTAQQLSDFSSRPFLYLGKGFLFLESLLTIRSLLEYKVPLWHSPS